MTDQVVMLDIRGAYDMVARKLKRIKESLIRERASHGRLSEADQWAVRKISSREREIERMFQSHYGSGEALELARLEMRLPKHDEGDIFRWSGRSHCIGWFGCRACDMDSRGEIHVRTNRLCVHCGAGVQHTTTIEGIVAASRSVGEVAGLKGTYFGVEVRTGATGVDERELYRLFLCDRCGWTDARLLEVE